MNGLSIVYGAAEFRCLPEPTAPDDDDQKQQHQDKFSVPDGWRVCTQKDADFELYRKPVIGGFPWNTCVVFVAKQPELKSKEDRGEFVAYEAKGYSQPEKGNRVLYFIRRPAKDRGFYIAIN